MSSKLAKARRHCAVRAMTAALRKRCGVREGDRVLLAVSGGCDSVALLRAMHLIADRRNWNLQLAVGHVQHHLRPEHAERDAQFVETLAESLDLPLLRADLSPPKQGNLEAWARQERYAALATMAKTFGSTFIATAHHSDDQLETLLMRMLRGSSIAGLRGIAWRKKLGSMDGRLRVIRPMLATTRDELVDLLQLLDQPWQEDHTNRDLTRTRARLRHEVLPTLKAIRSDASSKAVALADHARQVHVLVQAEVDRYHEHVCLDADGLRTLDRGEAVLMPRIVLHALLRRVLAEAGVPTDKLGGKTLGPIVHAIHDGKGGQRTFNFAGKTHLTLTRDTVTVA